MGLTGEEKSGPKGLEGLTAATVGGLWIEVAGVVDWDGWYSGGSKIGMYEKESKLYCLFKSLKKQVVFTHGRGDRLHYKDQRWQTWNEVVLRFGSSCNPCEKHKTDEDCEAEGGREKADPDGNDKGR